MQRATLATLAALILAAPAISPALAAQGELVSTASDQTGISLTIYNNGRALVKDKRRIDLPAGTSTLAFREVSARIRPETALLTGGPEILEQNFEYDLLSPESLLRKYVGREVGLVRQNPSTGEDLPPERALDKVGSMGVAIPGGRFELVDGELVYYGDNVTLGYAECAEDLAKGDERHGRLVTGDMARVDEDGFYYIVGRKKRFLKIYGNRVNLDETERLVKGRFRDLDCACGGVDDKMQIFVTDQGQMQAVRDFVAEKTHLNFAAFNVQYLASIPKNASGKTLYSELPAP